MSVEVITSIDQYLKFIFLAHKSQRSSGLLHIFWCLSSIIFSIFGFLLKNHWVIGSNLDVMLLGWSSSKILYDELAQHPNWLSWLLIGWKILVFENLFLQSSEPLEGMKPNLVQIVLGKSLFKIVSVDSVYYQRWPPRLIIHLLALSLVSDMWFTCNWYIEIIYLDW